MTASDPPATSVVVDLEMTNDLDAPSAHELAELHADLAAAGSSSHAGTGSCAGARRARPQRRHRGDRRREYASPRAGGCCDAPEPDSRRPRDVLDMSADSLQRLVDVVGAQIPAATGADQERLEALQRRLQDAIETITNS